MPISPFAIFEFSLGIKIQDLTCPVHRDRRRTKSFLPLLIFLFFLPLSRSCRLLSFHFVPRPRKAGGGTLRTYVHIDSGNRARQRSRKKSADTKEPRLCFLSTPPPSRAAFYVVTILVLFGSSNLSSTTSFPSALPTTQSSCCLWQEPCHREHSHFIVDGAMSEQIKRLAGEKNDHVCFYHWYWGWLVVVHCLWECCGSAVRMGAVLWTEDRFSLKDCFAYPFILSSLMEHMAEDTTEPAQQPQD